MTAVNGLKTFLCIFWNSCGVLCDRIFKKGLPVTPDAYYHKLINVSAKYRSCHDNTVKSFEPLHLQDNVRKNTKIQTKACFSTLLTVSLPVWLHMICIYRNRRKYNGNSSTNNKEVAGLSQFDEMVILP